MDIPLDPVDQVEFFITYPILQKYGERDVVSFLNDNEHLPDSLTNSLNQLAYE